MLVIPSKTQYIINNMSENSGDMLPVTRDVIKPTGKDDTPSREVVAAVDTETGRRFRDAIMGQLSSPDAVFARYVKGQGESDRRTGDVNFIVVDNPDHTFHVAVDVTDPGTQNSRALQVEFLDTSRRVRGELVLSDRGYGHTKQRGGLTDADVEKWMSRGGVESWMLEVGTPVGTEDIKGLTDVLTTGSANRKLMDTAMGILANNWGATKIEKPATAIIPSAFEESSPQVAPSLPPAPKAIES